MRFGVKKKYTPGDISSLQETTVASNKITSQVTHFEERLRVSNEQQELEIWLRHRKEHSGHKDVGIIVEPAKKLPQGQYYVIKTWTEFV